MEIELSITHSSAPGCEWSAWIGFKKLSRGFSLLAQYSEAPTTRTKRLARKYGPLTWRSACKTLLSVDEQWLICGDFRRQIGCSGLTGWQEELVTMCWFINDFKYRQSVLFLVEQPDAVLERLAPEFPKGLSSNDALQLVADLTNTFGEDCSVASLCGGSELISVELLRSIVARENQIDERNRMAVAEENERILSPFKDDLDKIVSEITSRWSKPTGFATGLGFTFRRDKLRNSIISFLRNAGHLPHGDDLRSIVKSVESITTFGLGNPNR